MGNVIIKEHWGKEFKTPEELDHWMVHGRSLKERIHTCLYMANTMLERCETFISDTGNPAVQEMTRKNLKLIGENWLKTAQDHAAKQEGWKIGLVEGGYRLITANPGKVVPFKKKG